MTFHGTVAIFAIARSYFQSNVYYVFILIITTFVNDTISITGIGVEQLL